MAKRFHPDWSIEARWHQMTGMPVAGVDEAGRGPLAGPVVAAAVILDPKAIPDGLNDSKRLGAAQRAVAFEAIIATSRVGIASAPPHLIDKLNIRGATLQAMARAISALGSQTGAVLTDGRDQPSDPATGLPFPGEAIIKGDALCLSIAAASIIAKVTRDRMMVALDVHYPGYGFASNKGYPTADHRAALIALGATPAHRRSYAPVRAALDRG